MKFKIILAENFISTILKNSLLLLFLFTSGALLSQSREYSGVVKQKHDSIPYPGINVQVKGTKIRTQTDLDGNFKISVPDSLDILTFSGIGTQNIDYKVDSEKHINILIEEYYSKSTFKTFGLNHDILNSLLGISLSNGSDIQPLVHFENLTTDFLYKISAQTDLKENYSIGAKLSLNYPNRYLSIASVEFLQKHLVSENVFYRDINLSGSSYLRFVDLALLYKVGHQNIKSDNSLGLSLGLQKSHIGIYYGFLVGYYSDYFNYSAFLQSFLFNEKISLRIAYDKVNSYDFLNFGISFIFIKTTNNDIRLTDPN